MPVTTVAWNRIETRSCRKLPSRWVVFGDGDGALVSNYWEYILSFTEACDVLNACVYGRFVLKDCVSETHELYVNV